MTEELIIAVEVRLQGVWHFLEEIAVDPCCETYAHIRSLDTSPAPADLSPVTKQIAEQHSATDGRLIEGRTLDSLTEWAASQLNCEHQRSMLDLAAAQVRFDSKPQTRAVAWWV